MRTKIIDGRIVREGEIFVCVCDKIDQPIRNTTLESVVKDTLCKLIHLDAAIHLDVSDVLGVDEARFVFDRGASPRLDDDRVRL